MAGDGYTIKSIAKALGRSPNGIQGMLRKLDIHTSRKNLTAEVCISIRKDALEILRSEARARGLTANALCRLALELCALDKEGWLERLLSEDASDRRHPAFELTEDPRPEMPSPRVFSSPVAVAPEVDAPPPAQSFTVVLLNPQLEARM
jgi:hypothetical protein